MRENIDYNNFLLRLLFSGFFISIYFIFAYVNFKYVQYLIFLIYILIFIEIFLYFKLFKFLPFFYLFISFIFFITIDFDKVVLLNFNLFILIVISFDIFSYVIGKNFGKNNFTKVSPNKTWEGFMGGVISTTIIGYYMGFLTPLNSWQLILVSFCIAIFGFMGDAIISAVKRDFGVKDMGNSIPGHGGFLDRIDSLSTTSSPFFHLIYFLVIV